MDNHTHQIGTRDKVVHDHQGQPTNVVAIGSAAHTQPRKYRTILADPPSDIEQIDDRAVADDIAAASNSLGLFIEEAARRTADEIGFGYVLTPDAPNNYPALKDAFEHSMATGAPLPISSENSNDVIYVRPSINGSLRFWHDVRHVQLHLTFDLVDELELSLWHLRELEEAGYPRGSLVWRLLHADLTGQTYVQAFAQRFPVDQRRFITGCVTAGFDDGLLDELRQGKAA